MEIDWDNLILPCVIKDHNAKAAIVVRHGRKYVFLVAMKSGKLTLTKQNFRQYEKNNYTILDADVKEVVARYLAHSGGLTDTARKELEAIK